MKVYVVTIGWNYESEQVAGVHVTAESAHAHALRVAALSVRHALPCRNPGDRVNGPGGRSNLVRGST